MTIIISLLTIFMVGWMILKRYTPQTVLIAAGIFLMLCAYMTAQIPMFLPAKQSTGFILFDIFEYIKITTSKDLAGLGLTIMVVAGYAKYMDHIGASASLVHMAMKPLGRINACYIIMVIGFWLCMLLSLVISSASSLAMLTMTTIFPILTRLGVSPIAAASVISTGHLLDIGPSTATTILVAETANAPIMHYFVYDQLPVYVVAGLFCGITHFFWQRYLDRKEFATRTPQSAVTEAALAEQKESKPAGPAIYALLPIIPLVLLIVFSELVIAGIKLTVVTAMFICFTFSMILELIRNRDLKKTFNGIQVFLRGMADLFVLTVSLVIAGEVFSKGLISIGAVNMAIHGAQSLNINILLIALGFVAVIIFFCIIMGSGIATMFAFAPLVPSIATGFAAPVIPMLLTLQNAASLGRLLSPISAVNIAVCGMSGLSPIELVKRNSVPVIVALIVATGMVFIRDF